MPERKPGLRQAYQASHLLRPDRLDRGDERASPAGLDLDEDVAAAVVAHQVDLAVAGPCVARQDAPPELREGAFREMLAGVAEDPPCVGHERRIGPYFP